MLLLALTPSAAGAAPSASLTGLSSGQAVSGAVALGANATADGGVDQVKWYVDFKEVGWKGSSPWQVNWDSTDVPDGLHTAFVKAADAWGNWGVSAIVTFNVTNAAVAGLTATWPSAGVTVGGSFNLTAVAPLWAEELKWYVDGIEVGWDRDAPWLVSWNSARVANGTHTIAVRALRNGVWIASPTHSFTVQNGGGETGGGEVSSKWRLLMSDDFNGSSLDSAKWRIYGPNWSGHAGNGLRDGRALSVANGLVTITARMIDGVLVSGGAKSHISQRYGRYEFRVRTDADPSEATNATVLTWPTSGNWPSEGENNIYETNNASRYPFMTFVHYSAQNQQYYFKHWADGTQWHTMAMEWEPDEIRIYRDGVEVWSTRDTWVIPDWEHQLTMQLDAFKSWMYGSVRLQVDWVRIYERAW